MPKAMVEAVVCGTCIHYYQHYVLGDRLKPIPLWYGHCSMPKIKVRRPGETCEHWEENRHDD